MMKIKYVFLVWIVVSNLSLAQISREEKLEQLKSRDDIKITEIENDILKIEYPNGKVLYKNIRDYQPQTTQNRQSITYSPAYDSTIIDLKTIDTTLYYQKYSFWQEVPLGNGPNSFLLVGDVNNNKLPELYGQMKDYTTDYTDIVIFEMNHQGTFDSVYSYDSTSIARSIFDIDKDGMEELHLRRFTDSSYQYPGNSYLFFSKSGFDSLAKTLSFVFYPFENYTQQNNNYFGDWDGDEFTDQIFHVLTTGLYVFEYNQFIPNFDSVYYFDWRIIDLEFAGFTIGDFDQDGKTEFFTGSTHGDVLCIESNGNNSYAPTWTGMVETYNAYQLAQTNDVDGNGRKEIWVGGDAFYPNIGPMTRITLFESDGNDNYHIVGRIDLVGVFSFFAQNYQAVDVDKDGIEEMMVCIEETVLILKFNGSRNHQTYEVFYYKGNDGENNNYGYYGANLFNLINDQRDELLINMRDDPPGLGTIRWLNWIYKPNFTVDVADNKNIVPVDFQLYPAYPNPLNPRASIKFDIPQTASVDIKVYNSLGKEIATLLEEELSPGSYTIDWEARDSNGQLLPSGVYLIMMIADNYTKTIKALLLK